MTAGGWPQATLGDVVEFLDHRRRPITASDREPGPYPYYGANGQQDSVAGYLFDERLVLLAEDGGHFDEPARGIAYRVEGRCWVNNHAHVLRPSERVDWAFLARVLENAGVNRHISGTTRAKLTKAGAAAISIPLPPIEEQRRIAAILDKADELRAKRRAALAHLDSLTQSIFLDMFGDPVFNSAGWPDDRTLGDIADIRSGVTKGRAATGPLIEVPYLAVANVQDRHLQLDTVKTIAVTPEELKRYRLELADLLLTEGGDPDKLGRGALWHGEIVDCIHQNHIFRVRLTACEVRPLYLTWLIGSQRGKRYFLRSAKQTTGIASINLGQLRAFPMLIPPLAIQQEFERRVGAVDTARGLASTSAEHLDSLFASLRHRAFSGAL